MKKDTENLGGQIVKLFPFDLKTQVVVGLVSTNHSFLPEACTFDVSDECVSFAGAISLIIPALNYSDAATICAFHDLHTLDLIQESRTVRGLIVSEARSGYGISIFIEL